MYHHGALVKDVMIQGNTFKDVADPVIHIHPEYKAFEQGHYVHENIHIFKNTFDSKNTILVDAQGVKDLKLDPSIKEEQTKLKDVVL